MATAILSFVVIIVYVLLVPSLKVTLALDYINNTQSLSDGMTLVSPGGSFALGFFSPGDSQKRYLGIWFQNLPNRTVVWVANRRDPLNDSSGILTLNSTGNLVLTQKGTVVWYTNSQNRVQNSVAYLLDSGNLVVRDKDEADPEAYLWQSFDYPTDTLLPDMKLGWDLKNNLNRILTAWKSLDDPSPGELSWGYMVLSNYPESYMMKGNEKYFRAGSWNGLYPSGSPQVLIHHVFSDKDEIYYTYSLNYSPISRLVISQSLQQLYGWSEPEKQWQLYTKLPKDICDNYALCGPNGLCSISESPICRCLPGFRPKSPESWNAMDWSEGCVRNQKSICDQTDAFLKLAAVKVPETTHTWLDEIIGLEKCQEKCLNNCSCTPYANSDIRGAGSGCVLWFGNLTDIRQFTVGGQELYIRLAASELVENEEPQHGHRPRNKKLTIIAATTVPVIFGVLLFGCCYICKVRRNVTEKTTSVEGDQENEKTEDNIDLPLLDFSTIAIATDNFSIENKIGQGGFGLVYKGRLVHGQEIAVKRLSRNSGQGTTEFKNEVKLIAKLQHRNLVKLLSCCIDREEKMLIYEYLSNSSLDSFIFDNNKGRVLDWSKRYHIILGIARGLLYLHQDFRLRIVHRDLKANNVLLDDKFIPKISDFGMTKFFGGDQAEGNTNRVVGTYGYMTPEYAADGFFSVKSDVFSFGILMLEIISGQKNKGFYHADNTLSLSGHAWTLWKEDRAIELIDKNIEESYIVSKVLRCIHVSLLCVQHHPDDRPTMSSVILMLESDLELAEPKQPGFFLGRFNSFKARPSSNPLQCDTTNEITITLLEAR